MLLSTGTSAVFLFLRGACYCRRPRWRLRTALYERRPNLERGLTLECALGPRPSHGLSSLRVAGACISGELALGGLCQHLRRIQM